MNGDRLWIVNLPYAYFGVTVNRKGLVSHAPPIAGWMVGKDWQEAQRWVTAKGGKAFRSLSDAESS